MSDAIRSGDLAPCDVLLHRGTGFLAEAIRLLDGSEVNHAALFLGDGVVAETTRRGVVQRGLAESVANQERVLGLRLKQAAGSMRPVRDRAVEIVADGPRYAYEQIVLLAFLCLTRKLAITPTLDALLRSVLDAAAAVVASILSVGAEPMICSELVYRAYDEADPAPDDPYTIEIGPFDTPSRGPRRARRQIPTRGRKAPGRGRAIHPASVLARMPSPPELGTRAGSEVEAAPASPPGDAELERLFGTYRSELRSGPLRAPGRIGPEVARSVLRFAAALSSTPASVREVATPRAGDQAGRRAAPRRSPLAALRVRVADFVTPGDLLRSESLWTVGPLEMAADVRGAPRPKSDVPTAAADRRRDPTGALWTLAGVEKVIRDIVAHLSAGVEDGAIQRSTRFGSDLGWDEWYVLRAVPRVRERLHVTLVEASVKDLETVGELVDMVWASMEVVS